MLCYKSVSDWSDILERHNGECLVLAKKNFNSIRDTFITQHFLEFAMDCLYISVDVVCAKMLCYKRVSDWAWTLSRLVATEFLDAFFEDFHWLRAMVRGQEESEQS